MGEVVDLDVITSLTIPPEKILRKAIEANLESVITVGYNQDGSFYFASSTPDGGNALWLLEIAKKKLLEIEVD